MLIFFIRVSLLLLAMFAISSRSAYIFSSTQSPYNFLEEDSSHQVNTELESRESALLVDQSFSLIDEGNRIIQSALIYEDVILVVGNTGAGKTTITKLIAAMDDLESYEANDGYLIRDRGGKISEKSTIISQTIFPNLIIDEDTNTAFYDLPGFGDTRNASVEIANACFMKKVADNAQRIKILLIVNYNSLRLGHSRSDFKEFLEYATDLIPNPVKFKSAIALVATKVEINRSRDRIINGIGLFLTSVKRDLHEVIFQEGKLIAAQGIIDILLSKDSSGNYNRISYFKQPDEEGPLAGLPEIMQQRAHILNTVYNNTNFSDSTSEDFGFSLTHKAKLTINQLVHKMNQDILSRFEKSTKEMSGNYDDQIQRGFETTYADLLNLQIKTSGFSECLHQSPGLN